MKQRSTTPAFKRFATTSTLVAATVAMVVAAPMAAYADVFDQKIRALQHQIDGYQSQASDLASQADTLKTAIARFDNQIAAIQAKINLSEAKRAELVKQIHSNQKKLDLNKQAFADTLGDMYVDGTPSPIEILASSDSISDYVDKQSYRDAMNQRLEDTINQINELQAKLSQQKKDVEATLRDQHAQSAQLNAKRTERNQLLAQTQGKEAEYQSLIKHNQSKISKLRAQQRAANLAHGGTAVAGDPGHGGYPSVWDRSAQDSMVDSWGMYNRECVSYAAWRVYHSGRHMPYGYGNANQWPGSARAAGYRVDGNPQAGDVAIAYWGPYGHAMYVEAVGNGQVYVSQYNYDLAGHYSEMWVSSAGLEFIHF